MSSTVFSETASNLFRRFRRRCLRYIGGRANPCRIMTTGAKRAKSPFVLLPLTSGSDSIIMTSVPPLKPSQRRPPKLDLRAFQSPPAASSSRRNYPQALIDSHIHLWTKEQLENSQMVWPTQQGGVKQLSGAHEMESYQKITEQGIKGFANGQSSYEGVVFVQAE